MRDAPVLGMILAQGARPAPGVGANDDERTRAVQ